MPVEAASDRGTKPEGWHEGYTLPERVMRANLAVDAMPPELRECVHEYGFAIVHAMQEAGVTDPKQIHHLVKEIWEGARQPAQRTGKKKKRSPVLDKIDWLLIQAGAGITAERFVRTLSQSGLFIVPSEPNDIMIAASLDATNHMGTVTKQQKHRNRLRAAIRAGMLRFCPTA